MMTPGGRILSFWPYCSAKQEQNSLGKPISGQLFASHACDATADFRFQERQQIHFEPGIALQPGGVAPRWMWQRQHAWPDLARVDRLPVAHGVGERRAPFGAD